MAARPAFEQGRAISVSRNSRGRAQLGDLVTVALQGRGAKVIEVHGPADDPRVILDAILRDAGRKRRFGAEARQEAEVASAVDIGIGASRRDLREQAVVTIDPDGAKDHDDAIIVERRDGGFRLFVHIADVAHFVPVGGPLDQEAARRAFSAYVPGAVDPMLPRELSAGACSLYAGVDRPVVTAQIDLAADGEPISATFYRALIHSRRDLTYEDIDRHFDGKSLGADDVEDSISAARELARALRARRMARGALEIESAEPRFHFDENGVAAVEMETQSESHQLIEECMIAANEAVARQLLARKAPGIFRVHEDPDQSSIERLYDQLEALDVATPPLSDGALGPQQRRAAAVAAAAALRKGGHGGAGDRALAVLVLRSLKQARYAIDGSSHSGLASDAYLHFTSPIRRYPDLLAHRALLATIGSDAPAPSTEELSEAAFDASEREREIAGIERRAARICSALLLRRQLAEGVISDKHEGEVVGVVGGGVFVAFGGAFEGFLPARTIGDEYFTADAMEIALVGERTGNRIALGDRLEIRVADIEPLRHRVDLEPGDGVVRRRRNAGRRR
jgi:ribonuclease R